MKITTIVLSMILAGLVLFGCTQESHQQQPKSKIKHAAQILKSEAITPSSYSTKVDTVDVRMRKQLETVFAKDRDSSIRFKNAAILNNGLNQEIVFVFVIDWIHARVKGKLQWGLSPEEAVVYQTYLAMFEHGRELLILFPEAARLRLLCCNQMAVKDKYGNKRGEELEPYFSCCQTKDMAQNLNIDNTIRTMYLNGTSAVAQYLDCTDG